MGNRDCIEGIVSQAYILREGLEWNGSDSVSHLYIKLKDSSEEYKVEKVSFRVVSE